MPRKWKTPPALTLGATVAALALAAHATQSYAHDDGQTDQIPAEIAARMAQMMGGGGPGGDADEEFPPFEEVSKDYEKVVTGPSDQRTFYSLWVRKKDGQVLAELPGNFESQKVFLAYTLSAGNPFAGIQLGDMYGSFKRYDKQVAFIQPNLTVRTTGDSESRAGLNRVFTDRVLFTAPIVTMGPSGGPVVDLDGMFIGQAMKFFGPQAMGANSSLARIAKAKAFPHNIELAFDVPDRSGTIVTMHYSMRHMPKDPSYRPRTADERVGYFTTAYQDVGEPSDQTPWRRYINRWKLEKADSDLKMSPPKEPIIFYIEHTTPIRYRRWVRDGVLEWNKAFEKVGIVNAVEVYQQDSRTGAHMEKDPEDARYNFVMWTNAPIGFAIGPSRPHPETGQILDADVVMSEGFVRSYVRSWRQLLTETAMEGFSPETLAWLDTRPQWDPRLRMADPAERDRILSDRIMRRAHHGHEPFAGHPAANSDPLLIGDDQYDGLHGRISQVNGMCMAPAFRSLDIALFRMAPFLFNDLAAVGTGDTEDEKKKEEILKQLESLGIPDELKDMVMSKMAEEMPEDVEHVAANDSDESEDEADGGHGDEEGMLDGVPENFIGPLIKDVIMHEIGHVLGLRHNFKASTVHSLAEINSEDVIGKPQTGSVMDYNPININVGDGPVQGDYAMVTVGPYDMWAIEYGYTSDKGKLKDILSRVADEDLPYATDEDTWGPDPRARRFDFGANPLDYAKSQMRLVKDLRGKLIEKTIEDGESWSKVTDGYNLLLGRHLGAVSVAANWVGGSYLNRDKKGDPGDRDPIEDIPAAQQRDALNFVIKNTFRDDSFALSSDLLRKMSLDKWWDGGGFNSIFADPTWPVHSRILAVQSAALTMVMNPTTLGRVYDNEYRVPAGEDAVTLPEVMFSISDEIWSELGGGVNKHYTSRKPMISSLRRNLQREHLERLIDFSMPGGLSGAASKPIQTLATLKLREIDGKIESILNKSNSKIDPYTVAHLSDAKTRIGKALDAQYIYNADDLKPNFGFPLFFGEPATE